MFKKLIKYALLTTVYLSSCTNKSLKENFPQIPKEYISKPIYLNAKQVEILKNGIYLAVNNGIEGNAQYYTYKHWETTLRNNGDSIIVNITSSIDGIEPPKIRLYFDKSNSELLESPRINYNKDSINILHSIYVNLGLKHSNPPTEKIFETKLDLKNYPHEINEINKFLNTKNLKLTLQQADSITNSEINKRINHLENILK